MPRRRQRLGNWTSRAFDPRSHAGEHEIRHSRNLLEFSVRQE